MATLLLFGRLAEQAGWRQKSIALPADVTDIAGLRAHLAAVTPEIAAISTRAAVNRALVSETALISDNDEIAFMPPMSGG